MISLIGKSELRLLGQLLVKELTSSFKAKSTRATQSRLDSFKFDIKEIEGGLELFVEAEEHTLAIDAGIKGNRSSRKAPKSPFRYKKKFGSYGSGDETFSNSLIDWIKQEGINSGNKNLKGLAFVMMRSIIQSGVKPVDFIQSVLDNVGNQLEQDVANGVEKNVNLFIDKTLKPLK